MEAETLARFYYEAFRANHDARLPPWEELNETDQGRHTAASTAVLEDLLSLGQAEDALIASGVEAASGLPYVHLKLGDAFRQIPPDDARDIAYALLEAAEGSEIESLLFRWLRVQGGEDGAKQAAAVIAQLRQLRRGDQTIEELTQEGEQEDEEPDARA